ncbi:hypothetical protein ACTXT7_007632 [Hymenolepis weldensis]
MGVRIWLHFRNPVFYKPMEEGVVTKTKSYQPKVDNHSTSNPKDKIEGKEELIEMRQSRFDLVGESERAGEHAVPQTL